MVMAFRAVQTCPPTEITECLIYSQGQAFPSKKNTKNGKEQQVKFYEERALKKRPQC